MGIVFVFFCEDIGKINFAINMCNFNVLILNVLSYCIFTYLDMSQSFRSIIVGPVDACLVVVVDLSWFSGIWKI